MITTHFDRMGGEAKFYQLADAFYQKVLADPLLLPLFRDPTENHSERMAWFLIQTLGGPGLHSEKRGGFGTMVRSHQGLKISEAQRQRWLEHMRAAASEVDMPASVMADFDRYIVQGSGLAAATSRQ